MSGRPSIIQRIAQIFDTSHTTGPRIHADFKAILVNETEEGKGILQRERLLFESFINPPSMFKSSSGFYSHRILRDVTVRLLLISHMMRELMPNAQILSEYTNSTIDPEELVDTSLLILFKPSNDTCSHHVAVSEESSGLESGGQLVASPGDYVCLRILFSQTSARSTEGMNASETMERALCEVSHSIGHSILPILCLEHSKTGILTGIELGWVEDSEKPHSKALSQSVRFDLPEPSDSSASKLLTLRIFLSLVRWAEHAKTTACNISSPWRTSILSNRDMAASSAISWAVESSNNRRPAHWNDRVGRWIASTAVEELTNCPSTISQVPDQSPVIRLGMSTTQPTGSESEKLPSQMKWIPGSGDPKKEFLIHDLDFDTRGGRNLARWFLDHYVFILPSPSNCVGDLGEHHRVMKEQLTAMVNASEPQKKWIPDIALKAALNREIDLLSRVAGSQISKEREVARGWDDVFRSFCRSSHGDDAAVTNDRWCYITECHIHYLRSFEYDQWGCDHKYLTSGPSMQQATAMCPQMHSSAYYSRPFMPPLLETILTYYHDMQDLSQFTLGLGHSSSQVSQHPVPLPENAKDSVLLCSITYASQLFSEASLRLDKFRALDLRQTDYSKLLGRSEGAGNTIKERMLKFPVGGYLEGSITVAIPNFLTTLLKEMEDNDDVDELDLSNKFKFFKKWEEGNLNPPLSDALHLPILLINRQEAGEDLENATINAQRLACVSAVSFLAALGIKDFPVYGLATYGFNGVVSQAWYSHADNCCYSMDGVTSKYHFDLRTEDGITRLMNFLEELKQSALRLRKAFDNIQLDLLQRARAQDSRATLFWTFYSQLIECELREKGDEEMEMEASDEDENDLDVGVNIKNSDVDLGV